MVSQGRWYLLRTLAGQTMSRPCLTNQENPAPRKFLGFTAHGHKHRHRSFSMHRLMHHFLTSPRLDHLPGPWNGPTETIQDNGVTSACAFAWWVPAFEIPTLAYSGGFMEHLSLLCSTSPRFSRRKYFGQWMVVGAHERFSSITRNRHNGLPRCM